MEVIHNFILVRHQVYYNWIYYGLNILKLINFSIYWKEFQNYKPLNERSRVTFTADWTQTKFMSHTQKYFTSTHSRWTIVLFHSALIPASTWCFRWTDQKKIQKSKLTKTWRLIQRKKKEYGEKKKTKTKMLDEAFHCQGLLLSVKIKGFNFMLPHITTLKKNSSGKMKQQHQERTC